MTRRILGSQHLKGRGALSNPPVRFESTVVERTDDGWYQEEEEGTPSLSQTVRGAGLVTEMGMAIEADEIGQSAGAMRVLQH